MTQAAVHAHPRPASTVLTFTDTERLALNRAAAFLSTRLGVRVVVETCLEDGDEWAALMLDDDRANNAQPLATLQLIQRPARGFAVIRPDGQASGSPTDQRGRAADFGRTLRHLIRLAVKVARQARSSCQALAGLMPKAAEIDRLHFALGRPTAAYAL